MLRIGGGEGRKLDLKQGDELEEKFSISMRKGKSRWVHICMYPYIWVADGKVCMFHVKTKDCFF